MIKMFDKLNVIIIITVINFVINKLSLKILIFSIHYIRKKFIDLIRCKTMIK